VPSKIEALSSRWRCARLGLQLALRALHAAEAFCIHALHPQPRFNAAVDLPITMKHGVYLKVERIVHELLIHSRAMAPASASAVTHVDARRRLYFVPLYVGQVGSSSSESGSKRSSRLEEVDAALGTLPSALWPSRSKQFIFVIAVDRGRCFQDDGVDRFRDATVLMHDGTAHCVRPCNA
jgi:hypothetical protein